MLLEDVAAAVAIEIPIDSHANDNAGAIAGELVGNNRVEDRVEIRNSVVDGSLHAASVEVSGALAGKIDSGSLVIENSAITWRATGKIQCSGGAVGKTDLKLAQTFSNMTVSGNIAGEEAGGLVCLAHHGPVTGKGKLNRIRVVADIEAGIGGGIVGSLAQGSFKFHQVDYTGEIKVTDIGGGIVGEVKAFTVPVLDEGKSEAVIKTVSLGLDAEIEVAGGLIGSLRNVANKGHSIHVRNSYFAGEIRGDFRDTGAFVSIPPGGSNGNHSDDIFTCDNSFSVGRTPSGFILTKPGYLQFIYEGFANCFWQTPGDVDVDANMGFPLGKSHWNPTGFANKDLNQFQQEPWEFPEGAPHPELRWIKGFEPYQPDPANPFANL